MISVKTILLVDDEKTFLLSLSEGLKMASRRFNILRAENGEQAIRVLQSFHVDLMFTDLKMPRMDGFGLLAHVVKNYPDMPTIVMTAFSTPDVVKKLHGMGFPCCLDKPLDFEDLLRAVRSPGILQECRHAKSTAHPRIYTH